MKYIARHIVFLACITVAAVWFLRNRSFSSDWRARARAPATCLEIGSGMIDRLIGDADRKWQAIRLQQQKDMDFVEMAQRYRQHRGRHPPPGFDKWYAYAQIHRATVPEEFFDQIYTDIEPYWAVAPTELRSTVAEWANKSPALKIRRGRITTTLHDSNRMTTWRDMIRDIAPLLPDMDLACNILDEPRVMATWETVNAATAAAAKQRQKMERVPLADIVQSFRSDHIEQAEERSTRTRYVRNLGAFHHAIRQACPPQSLVRLESHISSRQLQQQQQQQQHEERQHLSIKNVTADRDLCDDPRSLHSHGFLIHPSTIDFTTTLVPIFSQAKTRVNNDILLPGTASFTDDKSYTGKDFWGDRSNSVDWVKKRPGLIWRGSATGGAVCGDGWTRFHRYRFVQHLNATAVMIKGASPETAAWLTEVADAGFTKHTCKITDAASQAFTLGRPMSMNKQYSWKYLADVDGNSYSGRFRALMRSNSAVIKQTIFTEWHDSRLVAWKHYIPLGLSFEDLYGTMEYFMGRRSSRRSSRGSGSGSGSGSHVGGVEQLDGSVMTCAHDLQGQQIALDGRDWANEVMRKEDMKIYTHRLLLEYARVMDDDRDRLGFVQDLLDDPSRS